MRRLVVPLACLAALLSAVPAAADLRPVRRDFGELQLPRLRAGTITVPSGQARGRIRVLVRLSDPPLAQFRGRTFQAVGRGRKLDLRSTAARAYLASLARAQSAAAAELRRAIPEATVDRRYRILLNGLSVELPASRLPQLVRQSFADHVYSSLTYRLALNDSPSIIGADVIAATTGARGDGVRIAVVDDGIDQRNRFFAPNGLRYPRGFPRGNRRFTTPKVIVARSFPGPNAGRPGRLALDREVSFHGTHVAGIAGGNAGTTAPRGGDHPRTAGLTGVAPRVYLGNYRVFTVPTPIGHVANTPEIVAAFEAAVSDGMDVINFSGGGPSAEPVNDALIETVRNVAAAGVVPVISAGNDRDEFGLGTVGSPGTAPDAISVAATSNNHVFAPTLRVVSPAGAVGPIPYSPAPGAQTPRSFGRRNQTLVDVGSIVRRGRPVNRQLCSTGRNPNGPTSPLPTRSLRGAIALVSRGRCSFVSKAGRARAAGAVGLVLVDNRPGEANGIPVPLALPGGMISDFDGARLRQLAAGSGGRISVRIERERARIETGRSGIVTSFSSAGPTAFGHDLKPDVAAPGGQILSATLRSAGGPFAVFDGTSMSAPHVAGAAALLLQRHPAWTPQQVKSALVSTAGPAFGDTGRQSEASVLLQGGGLVNLPRADNPLIFTDPVSLSFDDLNVRGGARNRALLIRIVDAGGGAGDWTVELRPQSATAGATITLPPTIGIAAGGESDVPIVARASAGASAGLNYGFVVLRRGEEARRIPYLFAVTRPALAGLRAVPLRLFQSGDTRRGRSRVSQYGFPTAPFGPPPTYTGPPMVQNGSERLFRIRINEPVANFGVSVLFAAPGTAVDPWVLGSPDENDVQGAAGTPVNVNPLTFDYRVDIGAAGAALPRPKIYYVAVDSGRDLSTGRSYGGRYVLQSWVNDVSPPLIIPITTRVSTGRPTLVARIVDGVFEPGSGVDPLSLAIGYGRSIIGAAAYDPLTGLAVFPLPREAPALRRGRPPIVLVASDNQEAKNVNTSGNDIMPNTAYRRTSLRVVAGPTVTWVSPQQRQCAERRETLLVVAGSNTRVRSVRFFVDGMRRIATVRQGAASLYSATWNTRGLRRGRHVLRAVVRDANGRAAETQRPVRICRA